MTCALVAMTSCGSTAKQATLSDISGEWNVIEIDGSPITLSEGVDAPFLGFDVAKGMVYGNTGCNNLTGSFDMNAAPGNIDLSAMGCTRRMCPDVVVEQKMLTALGQVKGYKVLKNGNVILCSSENVACVVLQKKKSTALADLAGKWMIVEADKQAIADNMENPPFVEFNLDEKRLHGNAGCNVFNGEFLVDEAAPTAIAFPQVITTMMACPDMDVEGRILKALNEVRTFGVLADGAVGFYNESNDLVLVVKR